jgi:hypothetical protein
MWGNLSTVFDDFKIIKLLSGNVEQHPKFLKNSVFSINCNDSDGVENFLNIPQSSHSAPDDKRGKAADAV